MSFIVKKFLRCDRCGKAVETKRDIDKMGLPSLMEREQGLEGWIATDRDHHLCPECARPYLDKKDEMERELKRLAGIETIEVDL